jgi:hypothetical protein
MPMYQLLKPHYLRSGKPSRLDTPSVVQHPDTHPDAPPITYHVIEFHKLESIYAPSDAEAIAIAKAAGHRVPIMECLGQ